MKSWKGHDGVALFHCVCSVTQVNAESQRNALRMNMKNRQAQSPRSVLNSASGKNEGANEGWFALYPPRPF